MYYPLSDGRYHVFLFLWHEGGRRPVHEEFDTPGEVDAFLQGLRRLRETDRRFDFEVLTLEEYGSVRDRVRG